MAELKNRWAKWKTGWPWELLEAVAYAVMLILVLICLTGNGTFIYEF